jgi:hypothetical protein
VHRIERSLGANRTALEIAGVSKSKSTKAILRDLLKANGFIMLDAMLSWDAICGKNKSALTVRTYSPEIQKNGCMLMEKSLYKGGKYEFFPHAVADPGMSGPVTG